MKNIIIKLVFITILLGAYQNTFSFFLFQKNDWPPKYPYAIGLTSQNNFKIISVKIGNKYIKKTQIENIKKKHEISLYKDDIKEFNKKMVIKVHPDDYHYYDITVVINTKVFKQKHRPSDISIKFNLKEVLLDIVLANNSGIDRTYGGNLTISYTVNGKREKKNITIKRFKKKIENESKIEAPDDDKVSLEFKDKATGIDYGQKSFNIKDLIKGEVKSKGITYGIVEKEYVAIYSSAIPFTVIYHDKKKRSKKNRGKNIVRINIKGYQLVNPTGIEIHPVNYHYNDITKRIEKKIFNKGSRTEIPITFPRKRVKLDIILANNSGIVRTYSGNLTISYTVNGKREKKNITIKRFKKKIENKSKIEAPDDDKVILEFRDKVTGIDYGRKSFEIRDLIKGQAKSKRIRYGIVEKEYVAIYSSEIPFTVIYRGKTKRSKKDKGKNIVRINIKGYQLLNPIGIKIHSVDYHYNNIRKAIKKEIFNKTHLVKIPITFIRKRVKLDIVLMSESGIDKTYSGNLTISYIVSGQRRNKNITIKEFKKETGTYSEEIEAPDDDSVSLELKDKATGIDYGLRSFGISDLIKGRRKSKRITYSIIEEEYRVVYSSKLPFSIIFDNNVIKSHAKGGENIVVVKFKKFQLVAPINIKLISEDYHYFSKNDEIIISKFIRNIYEKNIAFERKIINIFIKAKYKNDDFKIPNGKLYISASNNKVKIIKIDSLKWYKESIYWPQDDKITLNFVSRNIHFKDKIINIRKKFIKNHFTYDLEDIHLFSNNLGIEPTIYFPLYYSSANNSQINLFGLLFSIERIMKNSGKILISIKVSFILLPKKQSYKLGFGTQLNQIGRAHV